MVAHACVSELESRNIEWGALFFFSYPDPV